MSKKNNKKNNNKKSIFDMLAPVLILVLTLCFIAYSIYNKAVDNNNESNKYRTVERTLDKRVFKSNSQVDIAFNNIDTSIEEYDILRDKCIEYANNNDVHISNIETSVKVTETTYIDSSKYKYKHLSDTMYETGPVYMDNAILLRFMNEKGELKIIAAKSVNNNMIKDDLSLDFDSSNINEYIVVDGQHLDKLFCDIENNHENLGLSDYLNSTKPIQYTNENNNFIIKITEDNYFRDISNIFVEIIKKSSDDIDKELKDKALNYFTYDGYNTIVNGVEHIESDTTNISVSFIKAGKSSIDALYCDRIVMQLVTESNNNKIYTNLIIKLDQSYKVFDIDII